MALKVLTTSSNLSESDGSWLTSLAGQCTFTAGANYDDVNTARYAPSSSGTAVTSGEDIKGVYLMLKTVAAPGAATLTVTLEEYITDTWTEKASSGALTVTNILVAATGGIYVPFTTPYESTGNNFRVKVVCNTSGKVSWIRSSSAGAYFYALMSDISTDKPTSSDTILLPKDITLTIDESCTLASNNAISVVVGDGATLTWENPAAASYTLNLGNGYFFISSNATVAIGDSTNRIATANQAIIQTSATTCLFMSQVNANIGYGGSKARISFFGELPTAKACLFASQTDNSGQKTLHLTEDVPAEWVNGHNLIINQKLVTADSSSYTLNTRSGKTLATTENLSYPSLKGGHVVNASLARAVGVKLYSSGGCPLINMNTVYVDYYKLDGVYMYGVSIYTPNTNTPVYSTAKSELKNIIFEKTGTYETKIYAENSYPLESENVYIVPTTSSSSANWFYCPFATFNGLVIRNLISIPISVRSLIYVKNFSFSNASNTKGLALGPTASGSIFTNGGLVAADINIDYIDNVIFNNVHQGGATRGLYLTSTYVISNLFFNNCSIGQSYVNDCDVYNSSNAKVVFSNSYLGSSTKINNYQNNLPGFYLKFIDYQNSLGSHRTYVAKGLFYSSSGKLVAKQEVSSGNIGLIASHKFISGTVTGMKIIASVGCEPLQEFSGLYTLPFLRINYDNGTVETSSASNSASRQVLSKIFTPTIDGSSIFVDLGFISGTANDEVRWDSLAVNARKYGYIFQSVAKTLTQYPTDVVAEISTPVTNSYITESDSATVGAYTGISINHSTGVCTISSNHSIQELYDYSQYDLTVDANMGYAEWLTTDGATYTSTYDIVVDGCVLSGAGKILNLGTNDFSTENGGSTTAQVVDKDGSLVAVAVTNIPEGARLLVEKTDGTELYNAEISGGTGSFNYNWTSDISINVKVRKGSGTPYYATWETSGTITNNGFSAICSPIPDNFATSYDSDIPTEWAITDDTSVEHDSGTDIYTVRELYSYLQDYFDQSTKMKYGMAMSAQTRYDFTMLNGYTMTDTSHQFLKGGSITEDDGDVLWSNFYTYGLSASDTAYVEQNGSLVSGWWGADDIDVLIKVMDEGSLIDDGNVIVYARTWGRTFTHYAMDLSAGGRTIAPIPTETDANNTTSRVTVAAYDDIDVSFEAVENYKIDDDDTEGDYGCTIDCNNTATMQKVYEYCKYLTDEDSEIELNGVDGMFYRGVDPAYTEVKNCPFGSLVGGTFYGAQGVRLINVPNTDELKFVLKDNDGVNHQATPAPVSLTITNLVAGSTVYIYDTNTSTELVNEVEATTEFTELYTYPGSDHTMTIKVRKAGYKTYETTAIATSTGMYVIADQEVDPVYAFYPEGIATDFTFDGATMAIAHASGTTIYTVRQLHSYLNYLSATTDYMEYDVPMEAKTNYEFELINSASMSEADHQYLKSGGIIEDDGDIMYANINTLGTIDANVNVYLVQDGSKISSWWGGGSINVLVKVKTGGTLINSGLIEVFARDFNYEFNHEQIDCSDGGRVFVSLPSSSDSDNQTASGTVSGYSDITLTEGDVSKDIGDGQGSCTYNGTIDCNGRTKDEVYEYLKYLTRRTSTTQIFSTDGEQFVKIDPSYTESKNGPIARMSAGILFAHGWWIENIDEADNLNYVVIDSDGVEHQQPIPAPYIAVTNIVDGSRIQVYDLDNEEELANEIVSGTSFSLQKAYTEDLDIRVRLTYVNGTTAKKFYETQGTFTSSGMSVRADQEDNAVYNIVNIDGSTVTECSVSGTTIRIYVDDPDNTTTAQRIYNWYQYYLFTEDGIAEQDDYISATDSTHYVFDDSMKIINQDTDNPLNITGANIVPTTGNASNIFDLTNGASICLNFNRVEGFAYSSGSGLSTEEHNTLMGIDSAIDTNLDGKISDVPTIEEINSGVKKQILKFK